MPAFSSEDNCLAAKIVSFYPENKTVPTHQAWVLYFDPTNGSLSAVSFSSLIINHCKYILVFYFIVSEYLIILYF